MAPGGQFSRAVDKGQPDTPCSAEALTRGVPRPANLSDVLIPIGAAMAAPLVCPGRGEVRPKPTCSDNAGAADSMRRRLIIGVLLLSGTSGRGLMTTQFLAPNSDVAARQGDIDMFEPRFSGSSLRTGDLATNPTTLSTLSIETKVPDHEVCRRRTSRSGAFPVEILLGVALLK